MGPPTPTRPPRPPPPPPPQQQQRADPRYERVPEALQRVVRYGGVPVTAAVADMDQVIDMVRHTQSNPLHNVSQGHLLHIACGDRW